jgi:hypothetical protein
MGSSIFKHRIYVGEKATMVSAANSGVKALNPKTMRFQLIDKDAKYLVMAPDVEGSILYSLYSDRDLVAIAKGKGLTFR